MATKRSTTAVYVIEPRDGGATKKYVRMQYNIVAVETDGQRSTYMEPISGGHLKDPVNEREIEYDNVAFYPVNPFPLGT